MRQKSMGHQGMGQQGMRRRGVGQQGMRYQVHQGIRHQGRRQGAVHIVKRRELGSEAGHANRFRMDMQEFRSQGGT